MNSRQFWKWRIWLFQASLYNPEPSKADDNEWGKSNQGKRFWNPRKNLLDGGWRGGEEGHKRWEEGALGQILLMHGKLSEYWVVYISITRGSSWERKWMFSSKSNHFQNVHAHCAVSYPVQLKATQHMIAAIEVDTGLDISVCVHSAISSPHLNRLKLKAGNWNILWLKDMLDSWTLGENLIVSLMNLSIKAGQCFQACSKRWSATQGSVL